MVRKQGFISLKFYINEIFSNSFHIAYNCSLRNRQKTSGLRKNIAIHQEVHHIFFLKNY